jgi:hypothetical protein
MRSLIADSNKILLEMRQSRFVMSGAFDGLRRQMRGTVDLTVLCYIWPATIVAPGHCSMVQKGVTTGLRTDDHQARAPVRYVRKLERPITMFRIVNLDGTPVATAGCLSDAAEIIQQNVFPGWYSVFESPKDLSSALQSSQRWGSALRHVDGRVIMTPDPLRVHFPARHGCH